MAIDYFQRALAIDPDYAPAYAGLGDAYNLLGDWWWSPPRDVYPKAKEAARRPLQLDDSLAEAHTTLAEACYTFDWDWPTCGTEFRRAIELNPNYATAHLWYSEYLTSKYTLCVRLLRDDECYGDLSIDGFVVPSSRPHVQNVVYRFQKLCFLAYCW